MTYDEPTVHMAPEPWQSPATTELFKAVLELESVDEAASFFRDLCTLGELHDMAQRWAVVRLLDAGLHYAEISTLTGASTATITRIAQWLRYGQGGYRLVLGRTRAGGPLGGPAATASQPASSQAEAPSPTPTSPKVVSSPASTSPAAPTEPAASADPSQPDPATTRSRARTARSR